jgi:hypothetical protein
MIVAVAKHLASRPYKVMILAAWRPEGALVNEQTVVPVFRAEKDRKYGEDWVNLGFLPGGEGAVARLAYDIKGLIKTDYYGNDVSTLPMMKDINKATDVDLVVVGDYADWLYMRQVWVPVFHIPIVSMKTAGEAAETMGMYPQSTKAVIGGVRSGAEYELLIKQPGLSTQGLSSVTLAVVLFVVTVIIGNIIYVWGRRKR